MATTSKQSGFLLISSLFVLSAMMLMASFYLSALTREVRVSAIVDTSPQAYYLAQAGIQDALWKLANDSSYKAGFETNPNWSASFTRSSAPLAGGSYEVRIENSGAAQATIIATSTVSAVGAQTQRVVRADVFKALSSEPTEGVSVFTNGELYASGSNVQVIGGDIFSNEDIELAMFSSWETDMDAQAVRDIEVSVNSELTAAGVYDQNNPPVPGEIQMPPIDFDSSDPESYKSRADQVYNTGAFKQLLKDYPVLVLDGITYVTGNVQIEKGMDVTINGVLVMDGSLKIGNGYSDEENPARVLVNKTPGEPSGILAKGNITIGGFNSDVDIAGLMYSGGALRITDGSGQTVTMDITGGIIAQDMEILVAWQPMTITHSQENIDDALGDPAYSQVLIINHWEEQY